MSFNRLKSKLGILDIQVEIVALKRRAVSSSQGDITLINRRTGTEETKTIGEWFEELSGYASSGKDAYDAVLKAKDVYNKIMDWVDGPPFDDAWELIPMEKTKLAVRVEENLDQVEDLKDDMLETVDSIDALRDAGIEVAENIQRVSVVASAASAVAGVAETTAAAAAALATAASLEAKTAAGVAALFAGVSTFAGLLSLFSALFSGGTPGDGKEYEPIDMRNFAKFSQVETAISADYLSKSDAVVAFQSFASQDLVYSEFYRKAESDAKLADYATNQRVAALETALQNFMQTTPDVSAQLSNYYTKEQTDLGMQSYALTDVVAQALTDYFTKSQVTDLIEAIPSGQGTVPVDLSNYYTKEETSSVANMSFDSNIRTYYNTNQTDAKIQEIFNTGIVNYYTKDETSRVANLSFDSNIRTYYNTTQTDAKIQEALMGYTSTTDQLTVTQDAVQLALQSYYSKSAADAQFYSRAQISQFVEDQLTLNNGFLATNGDLDIAKASVLAQAETSAASKYATIAQFDAIGLSLADSAFEDLRDRLFDFDGRRVVTVHVGDIGSSSGQTINGSAIPYYCETPGFITGATKSSAAVSGAPTRTLVQVNWVAQIYPLVPFIMTRNALSPTLDVQNDLIPVILSSILQENSIIIQIEESYAHTSNVVLYLQFFRVKSYGV